MSIIFTNRRSFLIGLAAGITAPAIITTPGLLMPVKKIVIPPQAWYVDRPHMIDTLRYLPTQQQWRVVDGKFLEVDGRSWDTAFGTITEILPNLSVGDIVYCRDTAWNGHSKIVRDRALSFQGRNPNDPMEGNFALITDVRLPKTLQQNVQTFNALD